MSGTTLQNALGNKPFETFFMALCTSSLDAETPLAMYRSSFTPPPSPSEAAALATILVALDEEEEEEEEEEKPRQRAFCRCGRPR